jgi:xanthine dehydrogenase accessory factor
MNKKLNDGAIGGYTEERVIRAPKDGSFKALKKIGDGVRVNEKVGIIENMPVRSRIAGVIRGLLRDGTEVWKGMKLGDVDPRGIKAHCHTISEGKNLTSSRIRRFLI